MANSSLNIPKVALLIESSRASGRALLKGIADYAHYLGPWSVYWEPAGLEAAKNMLKSFSADGIIMRDVDQVAEVLSLGIPTVVIGHKSNEIPGVLNIVTDSQEIGRLGADHLLQCGFRRFAFVGSMGQLHKAVSWSQVRQEYFVHRIRAFGFEVQIYQLGPATDGNWMRDRHKLAAWLKSLPKPIGLMACNDDCGVQVMESCKLAGISVPDAIGVIGADNDEIVCGLANPAMSSISINFERAGYEAAEALSALMQGHKLKSNRIRASATHVVARRSTDIVAVSDLALGKALQFIRNHSRRALSVTDVVLAAGVSRRVLERRFRQWFNASILDHIRKARTDQICRMLVETTKPIGDIAYTLGFENPQHFGRYFRTTRGVSPQHYRCSFGKQMHALRNAICL